MSHLWSRIRTPVKREGADFYLLVTLLSFGASVSLTRMFLSATGYPQLARGEIHVAHVLWGGLFLFAAALLPIIYANRWVYLSGAVLAGVGVGLFIDEVGKFITQSNDYFHPAAAPIIYAFFLLTVLLYGRVRRPPHRSARAELYRALEALEELLDHDLDESERVELEKRLEYVVEQAERSDLRRLAENLLEVVRAEGLALAPIRRSPFWRLLNRLSDLEARYVNRMRARVGLAGGMIALAATSLWRTASFLRPEAALGLLGELVRAGRLTSSTGLAWFSAQMSLQASVGFLLLLSAGMLIIGRERMGTDLSYLSLLLSLVGVNLIVFYFDQFATIGPAVVEFALLMGIIRYRQRFLSAAAEKA